MLIDSILATAIARSGAGDRVFTSLVVPIGFASIAIVMGLIVRGRWRMCTFLGLYIAWGVAGAALLAMNHELFFRQPFMMMRQGGLDLLKLAIALEIGWRAMRFFPGAAWALRKAWLVILAATALAALGPSIGLTDANDGSFRTAIQVICPRVQSGTLWAMVATLVVAHWYRVPLHSLHATLLTSFVAYLAVFLTLMTMLDRQSWTMWVLYSYLDDSALLLAECVWAHAVWRPERHTDAVHTATLRRLEATTSCG